MIKIFKTSKNVILNIDEYFNTVELGVLNFKEGVNNYLEGNLTEFENNLKIIETLEGKADSIIRKIENDLYIYSLIPNYASEVLNLLEKVDDIIDKVKNNLSQFDVEDPYFPEDIKNDFTRLVSLSVKSDSFLTSPLNVLALPLSLLPSIHDLLVKCSILPWRPSLLGPQYPSAELDNSPRKHGRNQGTFPDIQFFRFQSFSISSPLLQMTWIEYTALSLTSLIFLIGLATSLLPVVPGSLIVWSGIIIHKIWMGDASVAWKIVITTGIITLIGQLADFVLGVWGARKFGASWKGAVGALLGAFVGSFLIGAIYTFGTALLPDLAYVILFLPMIVVIAFRPRGLFGRQSV